MNYTLSTLKAAIKAWLEEDGAEFSAALDEIIQLAEQQVVKDLPFTVFDEVEEGSFSGRFIDKPSGMVKAIDLFNATVEVVSSVSTYVATSLVEPKTPGYVTLYGGATAEPIYYADVSEGQLQVAPPADAQPYILRYIKRPESLLTAASTTWISENVPEVLFWACVLHAEFFRKADERTAGAKDMYMTAKTAAETELRHLIRMEYR